MKKLSFEEFSARTNEVLKAQKIFGNFTNNISISFAIYQEVLAEEKRAVFISTAQGGNRAITPIDNYERPLCPECSAELRLKIGAVDADGQRWETSWVCEKCYAEYFYNKTPKEWMEELTIAQDIAEK